MLAATSVFNDAILMYPGITPFTPSTSRVLSSANTLPTMSEVKLGGLLPTKRLPVADTDNLVPLI